MPFSSVFGGAPRLSAAQPPVPPPIVFGNPAPRPSPLVPPPVVFGSGPAPRAIPFVPPPVVFGLPSAAAAGSVAAAAGFAATPHVTAPAYPTAPIPGVTQLPGSGQRLPGGGGGVYARLGLGHSLDRQILQAINQATNAYPGSQIGTGPAMAPRPIDVFERAALRGPPAATQTAPTLPLPQLPGLTRQLQQSQASVLPAGDAGPFAGKGVFTASDPESALRLQGKVDWVAIRPDQTTAMQAAALKAAGFKVMIWQDVATPNAAQLVRQYGAVGYIAQAETPAELAAATMNASNVGVPKALVSNNFMARYPPGWIAMPEAYQGQVASATPDQVTRDAQARGAQTVVPVLGTYGSNPGVAGYAAAANQTRSPGVGLYLSESMTAQDVASLPLLQTGGGLRSLAQAGGPPQFSLGQPLNPNDPALAAALAALNPSGVSSLAPSGMAGTPLGPPQPDAGAPPLTIPSTGGGSPIVISNSGGMPPPPAYTTDPGYQQALAAQTSGNAQLDAWLNELRQQAIVRFGDPGLAQAAGYSADPATQAAAQANYQAGNADLARLDRAHGLQRRAVINQLAAHGILNSGDLGYLTGQADQVYGNQVYDARNSILDYLRNAYQQFLDRRQRLQGGVTNALQNAFQNQLANIQAGILPDATSGGYGPPIDAVQPFVPDLGSGFQQALGTYFKPTVKKTAVKPTLTRAALQGALRHL